MFYFILAIIHILCFIYRYTNYLPEKIEECSYYNRNYQIFAENGYNWSMKHLNNTNSIKCQYYDYSSRESIVPEVCTIFNMSATHIHLHNFISTTYIL